jgi:hypothetical protein
MVTVDELNPKFVAITQAVEARLKSTNDTMDAIEISINDRFDRVQLALDRLRKVVLSKYPVDTETKLSNELEKSRFATRVGKKKDKATDSYWHTEILEQGTQNLKQKHEKQDQQAEITKWHAK